MIIGFTGKMGSGKSTAIAMVEEIAKVPSINVKFAQPLYDIQEAAYSIIEGAYTRPETFVKDRKLLQWIGTEWGRGLSEDLWVNLWQSTVQNILEYVPQGVITCDDVRFDNEAEKIKSMGGIIIKIQRSEATPDAPNGIAGHASEKGVSDSLVDFVINNDYDKTALRMNLERILQTKA